MQNNLFTINLSMKAEISLGTTEINSIFYNTKIIKQKSSFSSIQITPITTNATTQVSLARNMISAFTINSSNVMNQSHHNIMVAILLGIFMCITLSITISIFVFCRKKNSVFMLQKCEQDSDLEMNDMNTEVDTSDSEYEFIESSTPTSTRRSLTCPELHVYQSEIVMAEETHVPHSQNSKTRLSNSPNRADLPESPTSTPLLNQSSKSLNQTGSMSLNAEMYSRQTLPRHSLSLDFVTEFSGASEQKRHKEKKPKLRKDKNDKKDDMLKPFEMQLTENSSLQPTVTKSSSNQNHSKKSSSKVKGDKKVAHEQQIHIHFDKISKSSKIPSNIKDTRKRTGNSDSVISMSSDFRNNADFSIFDSSLRSDISDSDDIILTEHSDLLFEDIVEDNLDETSVKLETV